MTNSTTTHSVATKVTLLLASTLTVMAGATICRRQCYAIAPSLPQMQKHFEGVENVELLVRLVLTVPALFIAIASSAIGIIVDRFGRKPVLIFSAAVYGLVGSSGFFSNSLLTIILGRAFLGFAVAGIMVSATTLIADYYILKLYEPQRSVSARQSRITNEESDRNLVKVKAPIKLLMLVYATALLLIVTM
jgi:MFS family permease